MIVYKRIGGVVLAQIMAKLVAMAQVSKKAKLKAQQENSIEQSTILSQDVKK